MTRSTQVQIRKLLLSVATGFGAAHGIANYGFAASDRDEVTTDNTPIESERPTTASTVAPRNVVIILSDDHRYDFMSFMPGAPRWLKTPNLDRMRQQGAHLSNAFVSTSLCSPSRASILTGLYAHRHGVVDNSSPIPAGTTFFPQLLQRAGVSTAYIGKWHMGEDAGSDRPRAGFDRWISFRGQGSYIDPTLNVDGRSASVRGYTTDILTDSAVAWLDQRGQGATAKPFFMVLAHKAVHAEFVPAPRHAGRYADSTIPYPATMARTETNARGRPRWVLEQRNSWHGVDYAYHGQLEFDKFYRQYTETLLSLDESVGRVLSALERNDQANSTLVLYMSDNGFLLGEHGLIDKRNAYEASMRIPMLAWAPGWIAPGATVTENIRNIDIAPTVLDLAGVRWPDNMPLDGRSFRNVLPVGGGTQTLAQNEFLYEYYWEYAFPHTPTTFALRGDRFKYIMYHGIWDINELFDLRTDPLEQHNLVNVPAYRDTVSAMRTRLFNRLEASNGMFVPLRRGDWQAAERKRP